jgi:hypothetical protein
MIALFGIAIGAANLPAFVEKLADRGAVLPVGLFNEPEGWR